MPRTQSPNCLMSLSRSFSATPAVFQLTTKCLLAEWKRSHIRTSPATETPFSSSWHPACPGSRPDYVLFWDHSRKSLSSSAASAGLHAVSKTSVLQSLLQRFALKLHKRLLFRLDFVFLTARTWCKLTKTTSSSASLSDSVFQQAVRVSKCSTPNFDPGVGAAAALLLSPVAWPKSPSSSCPAF